MERNTPQVLVDYAWYQDGRGLIGLVPSVKLPALTKITEEFVAGGMAGPIDIDMGMVEKMTATVTLAEPNPETIKLFGLTNGQEKQFTFRSALQGKETTGFTVRMTGRVIGLSIGDIERKKLVETECEITLTSIKIEHGKEVLIDIDHEGGRMIVGGVDLRADINNALGI